MIITLNLSDDAHLIHTRISEVGVTLRALLHAYAGYDEEIAKVKNADRVTYLRLEQAKTGEVYQKLMDTITEAKEGRGV